MDEDGWTFDLDRPLGKGGFARVYEARDPSGRPVAAKVVPKQPGADRELLAVDLPPSSYVVPLLYVGETADDWVLFMPRAEGSLRDRIADGPIEFAEGLGILHEVAEGLAEIHRCHVVHRDLKPENILRLDGHWALADFGISRYVDASTDTATHKWSMTAPYAAPEQWKFERATPATDVYAFGVIGFEIISGSRPFPGPDRASFSHQHQFEMPPAIEAPRAVASLLEEALFKAAGARPPVENVLARLDRAEKLADSRGASALLAAQQRVTADRAAAQIEQERELSERTRRAGLKAPALSLLNRFMEELTDHIAGLAPATDLKPSAGGFVATLGNARLSVAVMQEIERLEGVPWDVIAYSKILIEDISSKRTRSHSLYYGSLMDPEIYQWYELGFSGSFGANFEHEPRSLTPPEAVEALSPAMGRTQLGYGLRPLNDTNLDEFIERWAELFGTTASSSLPRPSRLPDGETIYPRRA